MKGHQQFYLAAAAFCLQAHIVCKLFLLVCALLLWRQTLKLAELMLKYIGLWEQSQAEHEQLTVWYFLLLLDDLNIDAQKKLFLTDTHLIMIYGCLSKTRQRTNWILKIECVWLYALCRRWMVSSIVEWMEV